MFNFEGFLIIATVAVTIVLCGLAADFLFGSSQVTRSGKIEMSDGAFERLHNPYAYLSMEEEYALGECLKLCQQNILSPCFDPSAAEVAIVSIYQRADLAKPLIVWTKSPLASRFAKIMADGLSDKQADYNGRSLLAAKWRSEETNTFDYLTLRIWKSAWDNLKDSQWPDVKCRSGQLAWNKVVIANDGKTWKDLERDKISRFLRPYLREHRAEVGIEDFYPETVLEAITSHVEERFSDSSEAQTWLDLTEDWSSFRPEQIDDNQRLREDFSYYADQMQELIVDSFIEERHGQNEQHYKGDFIDLFLSGGWVRPFQNICFVSEPHEQIKFDANGRLHCETGPAVTYPDGFSVYAWHGTLYPSHWADNKPTAKEALYCDNVERRRVACEMVGWDNVLREVDAIPIDKDEDPEIGELLKVDMPQTGEELFLRVKCGTGRDFVLPVPPEMRTARQANAWTWGLEQHEYHPEVRT